MANITSKSEQARLLTESSEAVKQQAALMRRGIERNDLKDVLKHAAVMLGELRTGSLTPKSYYELYLSIFDHLGILESFLYTTVVKAGVPAAEVYELVQHAGNVLPRLYLMITAGSAYIKSGQAAASDVLTDLAEYIKGVQHPLRGLFVRYYLVQRMKDRLPDARASIDFLTGNLVEMNRLWVRMQTPAGGLVRNRKRRERERQELRLLVGANLTRLASLHSLDLELYRTAILPRVSEEIVGCKDKIAQAYLYEGLLQVFPLEFHTRTLEKLLGLLPNLVPDHETLKAVALALLARIEEGATMQGEHDGDSASASHVRAAGGNGATASVAAPSILGLPTPPIVLGVLPPDVDVFGTILSFVSGLASEASGPFRPGAVEKGKDKKGKGGAGDDSDDEGPQSGGASSSAASASASASASPAKAGVKVSARLAALRDSGDTAAALQPMASLLGIFTALENFTLSLYPNHKPYVDAVLGMTSKALRDCLGVGEMQDPDTVAAAGAPQAESASASIPEAREALSHLLDGAASATAAAPSSSSAAAPPSAPLGSAASSFSSVSPSPLDDACSKLVVGLLETAQNALGLQVLDLKHYAPLMSSLAYRHKREVAGRLLLAVLGNAGSGVGGAVSAPARVADVPTARRLYSSLQPLIRDDDATFADALPEAEERMRFAAEQADMCRLVHLLGPASVAVVGSSTLTAASSSPTPSDLASWFDVLCVARDFLSWGGPRRVSTTYPPLLHESLRLVAAVRAGGASAAAAVPLKRVFGYAHDVCFTLSVADHGELALKMFLQAAVGCEEAHFAQEFFSQAFLLHEGLPDSRRAASCLLAIISSLAACSSLESDSYMDLATRCTQIASRLLRKPDQVRALLAAARLSWRGKLGDAADFHKPREYLACLQRALRTADATLPAAPVLFIDVLNGYIGGYESRVPTITPTHLVELITLCRQHVSHAPQGLGGVNAATSAAAAAMAASINTVVVGAAPSSEAPVSPSAYLNNTLSHITSSLAAGEQTFAGVVVPH